MTIKDRLINQAIVEFQAVAHGYLGDTKELSSVVREFTAKLQGSKDVKVTTQRAIAILHETFSYSENVDSENAWGEF